MSFLASTVIKIRDLNPLIYRMDLRRDLIITLLNGIGVIGGILILYGLIARWMGLEALGEFLLVRRTAFSLMGVFLVGMNIGLPYYVSREDDNAYGAAAMVIFVLLTIPLVAVVSVMLYLGSLSGFPQGLALPFFIFSISFAVQYMAYGLLRGHLNMVGANLLQLIGTGLIPIGMFVLFHDQSLSHLLIAMGLGTLILSGAAYLFKMGWRHYGVDRRKIGQLLVYGSRRIPSFASEFILLAGVPLLILSDTGKAEIAYFSSGISLIRLFLFVVGPLSVVLLPRVSKAILAGRKTEISQGLEVLCKVVFLVGVWLALYLSLNSSVILRIWFGSENEVGVQTVQFIILALPFYLVMEVLRSPIDAASVRSYNSTTYGAAALALLVVYYGLRTGGVVSITAGAISFVMGYLIAGVISLYYANKLYGISILSASYLVTVVGATASFFLFLYWVNSLVPGVAALLIGGGTLVTVLSLFFLKSHSEWVRKFRSLVVAP